MPLYEYECDVCSHRFEVIQKYSDAPIAICPVCGGAVTKLFSSPAIQFKGSGFYITDYARAGKGESGKGESGGDSANASAGKSESGSSSESTGSKESSQGTAESKADARSDAKKKKESSSDTKSESKPAKTESAAPAATSTKPSTP